MRKSKIDFSIDKEIKRYKRLTNDKEEQYNKLVVKLTNSINFYILSLCLVRNPLKEHTIKSVLTEVDVTEDMVRKSLTYLVNIGYILRFDKEGGRKINYYRVRNVDDFEHAVLEAKKVRDQNK